MAWIFGVFAYPGTSGRFSTADRRRRTCGPGFAHRVQLDLPRRTLPRRCYRWLREKYAAKFSLRHAFADEQSFITHPDVDLVVNLAPAPEPARLAKAAIAVYSEWP
jgi:predicted dehydrogenase